MTNRRHLTILSVLLVSLGLLGCDGGKAPDTVAIILPLSGASAPYGEAVARGVELGRQELARRFEDGSYPFELALEVHDSASDPATAAGAAEAAFDAGAIAAIGGVTNEEADALGRVADRAERVLLSPSATRADPAGDSRYVFRLFPSNSQEANKMANFAALELELAEAAILLPATPGGQQLADAFRTELERNGGKVVTEVAYPDGAEDVSSFVAKALAGAPPAVYLAAVDAEGSASAVLSELERRRFRGTVMTTSAFATTEALAGADGLLVSRGSFDPASEEPQVQAFVAAYRERYDAEPDLYAAYGYDSVMVLAQALADTGGERREVVNGLRGLSAYPGVTGYVQFDEHGDVSQYPRIYLVENGRMSPLGELEGGERRRLTGRVASFGVGARDTVSG